jgi:formiminotetrahydrofolate cyclodeaminase
LSLESFLAAVAERTPAPGGGAGAAAGCGLGAALAEMAARFAGRDEEAARAAALRAEALRLGEADLSAYAPVLEALRLPADDPRREERVAAAKSAAAEVPLAIAEAAAEVAELARGLARAGKRSVVGDALAGADIAAGACRAAARLVAINLAGARADPRVARARAAVERADAGAES